VLTAVVIQSGDSLRVKLVSGEGEEGHSEDGHSFDPAECAFEPEESNPNECGPGPSPIIPEMKELVWGAGAFIVFALLMRFFLFPRLKKGMDARYNSIREGHENADAARSSARSEVAQYEARWRRPRPKRPRSSTRLAPLSSRSVRPRSPRPTPGSTPSVRLPCAMPMRPRRRCVVRSRARSPMWCRARWKPRPVSDPTQRRFPVLLPTS